MIDTKYIEYFFALKKVYTLHKKYNFGISPDIPSGYSESLCRSLFHLSPTDTQKNDAQKSNGDLVEIKATGTQEGKTTISTKGEFTELIWLYFDFENNLIKTYTIKKENFELDSKKDRKSIRLKTIVETNNIDSIDFIFNLQKIL